MPEVLTSEQFAQYTPLKTKMLSLGHNIKAIVEQGRLVANDPSQLYLFRGMYQELKPYFYAFNNVWDKSMELIALWQRPDVFPTQEDEALQQAVKRYYYEACAVYEEHMNPIPTAALTSENVTTDNLTAINESRTVRARLPQINLPTFNGNQTDWPLFRDTYRALIHDEESLSEMEKYLFLVSCLQGPALTLIKGIDLQKANYQQAWARLNDTYNDRRRLAASYLRNLLEYIPFKSKPSTNGLKNLATTVGESISSFKKLNVPDGEDFILFCLLLRCLDPGSRTAFEKQHCHLEFPTVKDLLDFIRTEWRSSELSLEESNRQISYRTTPQSVFQQPHGKGTKPSVSLLVGQQPSNRLAYAQKKTLYNPTTIVRCPICKENHTLYQCTEFRRLTPLEKTTALKGWKGCTNCLSARHSKSACTSKYRCQSCSRDHHSWLHLPKSRETALPVERSQIASSGSQEGPSSVALASRSPNTTGLLGTAIIDIQDAEGNYQKIRAVIDCGSHHSFITEECCRRLGLTIESCKQKLFGMGQTPLEGIIGKLNCYIRSSCRKIRTDARVITNITGPLPDAEIPSNIQILYQSYVLADDNFWKPGPIDFLLGGDIVYDIITGPPLILAPDVPRLLPTIFGFIVAGPMNIAAANRNATSLFIQPIQRSQTTTSRSKGEQIIKERAATATPSSESRLTTNNQAQAASDFEPKEELKTIMTRFWELEEVPKRHIVSEEDELCETHFRDTHYRLPSGRYVVSLPLKDSINRLANPNQQALERLYKLESKLNRQPILKEEYHHFMREYALLGHMKLVPTGTSAYTIPHHAVTKIQNGHIKLRVVFDASCSTQVGSLNDHMFTGPKLQLDISEIITNFRIHRFVFTADIVKMYRQILVSPADRKYQHVFWRFNPPHPVEEYELNTITYGEKASPFLALRTIQQLAHDEGEPYPLATKALLNDIYVDDIVTGADTILKMNELRDQLVTLLDKGGFQLSKWASNLPDFRDNHLKNNICSSHVSLSSDEDPRIKLLGIQWDPKEDIFSYEISTPSSSTTKRAMLSAIARIYDPLGYLSPVTFYAKTILQEMWIAKVGWDEKGPACTFKKWQLLLEQLNCLKHIKIPRLILLPEILKCTLVGFCDASLKGYAAVLYLHVMNSAGCKVSLLKSKTKLAPLKPMSIPRLELSGALLLCRLFQSSGSLLTRLNINNIKFYTDSRTVLAWLSLPPTRCNIFVAHRVMEILEHTTQSQWNYIKSEENPADCSSRGILPSEILHHSLWWAGPLWLSNREETWPTPIPEPSENLPELRQVSINTLTIIRKPDIDEWIERFSSYTKLVRSLAYALRFITKVRSHLPCCDLPISLREFRDAEKQLIRIVQRCYKTVNNKFAEPKHLLSLQPFRDQNGLLRVGGRLQASDLTYDAKHPILLPGDCHLARILVDYYHQAYLHLGATALLTMLRSKYWITGARSLVRRRIFQCLQCYKALSHPQAPLMGELPPSRFQEGYPFSHVGVDFGGPFVIRESSRRKAIVGKAYLCLFICMSTKAVHLEVVSKCSTDAFLAAFSRFISRRGKPARVYSDCGTNFVGAANRLRDLYLTLRTADSQKTIIQYAVLQEIEWSFNPPSAPHFGGLWEAGIKASKAILRKVIGDTPLTFEEITTVFCNIEGILNSRPLVPLTRDPEDIECLTPGHLLIGRSILSAPEQYQPSYSITPFQRWRLIQQKIQHFWSKWRLEYLNQLQQRRKWTKSRPNLNVGDLVIVKEPNSPPRSWLLARIVQTYPGRDGVVRVVAIRTASGIYKRPIVKVVPLTPINEKGEI